MVMVYLLLRAEHGKIGIVKTALSKYEEIEEIHEVFGRYDIFAKVIKNKIRIQEGIKSIEPVFVADDDSEN